MLGLAGYSVHRGAVELRVASCLCCGQLNDQQVHEMTTLRSSIRVRERS